MDGAYFNYSYGGGGGQQKAMCSSLKRNINKN